MAVGRAKRHPNNIWGRGGGRQLSKDPSGTHHGVPVSCPWKRSIRGCCHRGPKSITLGFSFVFLLQVQTATQLFPPPTSSFRALFLGGGEEEGVSLLLEGLGVALPSVSPVPLPVGSEVILWDVGGADGCCLDPGCSEPLQKLFSHCGVQCDVFVLGDALLQGGFSSEMLWVGCCFFFLGLLDQMDHKRGAFCLKPF